MKRKVATCGMIFVLLFSSISFAIVLNKSLAFSFSTNIPVDSGESHGTQGFPRIAVDSGGNISVVWAEGAIQPTAIFYAKSEDSGSSFLEKIRVDDVNDYMGIRSSPSIAINDNGSIFVVWEDSREDGISSIFFSRSDDGGKSFSANVRISSVDVAAYEPDIAISNGTIVVVWSQNVTIDSHNVTRIYCTRSFDWGSSFEVPHQIDSYNIATCIQNSPRIAALGDHLIVVWEDSRSDPYFDIYGAVSNNSGENFSKALRISDGPSNKRQTSPDVCFANDGNIAVVWEDYRSGTPEIRIATSSNGVAAFSFSSVVSDGGYCVDPSVDAGKNGIVAVVYKLQTLEEYEIRLAISRNDGTTFSPSIRVDDATSPSKRQNPDIAVGTDGWPLVVFEDRRTSPQCIMFARMLNMPPSCTILQPLAGSVLQGTIHISGLASDSDGNDTLVSVQVRLMHLESGEATQWINATGLTEWSVQINTTEFFNGDYLIEARAYDGDAYSEYAFASVTIDNPIELFPDLVITSSNITFSPAQLEEGDLVRILVNVTNIGNANASDVEIKAMRGAFQIGTLKKANFIPINSTIQIDFQWQALQGLHTIIISVDPDDKIKELNESNNIASTQILVPPSTYFMPDLVIEDANISFSSSDIKDGDEIVITASIRNLGTEDAMNVMVTFAIDGTPLPTQKIIPYLPINGTATAMVTWIAIKGSHTVTVIIDPSNQIPELNESNNMALATINVSSVEDFPLWILVIPLVLVFVGIAMVIYVMKWRRPE